MKLFRDLIFFILGAISTWVVLIALSYYQFDLFRDNETYQELGEGLSQYMLKNVVIDIENYRNAFGVYPDSILTLRNGSVHIDPALDYCECLTDYFYMRDAEQNSYFLFSKGRDCLPFTEDDLHPELNPEEILAVNLVRTPLPEIEIGDVCEDA